MITVNKLFNVISFEDIWSQLTSEFPEHFFYKTKNLYSQLFSYFANTEPDNSCGEKELQVLGYKETHQDYIVLCSFEDQFEYVEAVFLPWNIVSAAIISKETIQCYGAVELCKKIFVGLVGIALNDENPQLTQTEEVINITLQTLEIWKEEATMKLINQWESNFDEDDEYYDDEDFNPEGIDESDDYDDEETDSIYMLRILFGYSLSKEDIPFPDNDIQLIFDEQQNIYSVEMPNIRKTLSNENGSLWVLKKLLREFTKWMRENKYDTHRESDVTRLLSWNSSTSEWFLTIEEAYACFRDKVKGYILLIESESDKKSKKKAKSKND